MRISPLPQHMLYHHKIDLFHLFKHFIADCYGGAFTVYMIKQ